MTLSDRILKAIKLETELSTRLQVLKEKIDEKEDLLSQAEENAKTYKAAGELLVNTSLAIQTTTTEKIANIVTEMYRYVFMNNDRFVIDIDTKRSVPVASFYIETIKNGKPVKLDPLTSDGGGKVDVISLGLRLAALLLYSPALEKVLILDEPLRFLSSASTSCKPYRLRAVEFLKQIAKEYGIQVIAVTHDEELVEVADCVHEVTLGEDGYSIVTTKEEV